MIEPLVLGAGAGVCVFVFWLIWRALRASVRRQVRRRLEPARAAARELPAGEGEELLLPRRFGSRRR
ncbi:MAG: hypothetical protein K2Y29_17560 [Beijerinckiaceae bacterium]|nr:hypothetical protein [Beijerinckiaceae bacterium]